MTTLLRILFKAVLLSVGPVLLLAGGILDAENAFYLWFGMCGVMAGYETEFLK
jgi:hypothetical protein